MTPGGRIPGVERPWPCRRVAQFAAPDRGQLRRQGRARRFLHVYVHQLAALPYIRAWAQKYRQGLVVIGVHTPEFEFERNVDNVRRALGQMRIDYPIAIDSDYAIPARLRLNEWALAGEWMMGGRRLF